MKFVSFCTFSVFYPDSVFRNVSLGSEGPFRVSIRLKTTAYRRPRWARSWSWRLWDHTVPRANFGKLWDFFVWNSCLLCLRWFPCWDFFLVLRNVFNWMSFWVLDEVLFSFQKKIYPFWWFDAAVKFPIHQESLALQASHITFFFKRRGNPESPMFFTCTSGNVLGSLSPPSQMPVPARASHQRFLQLCSDCHCANVAESDEESQEDACQTMERSLEGWSLVEMFGWGFSSFLRSLQKIHEDTNFALKRQGHVVWVCYGQARMGSSKVTAGSLQHDSGEILITSKVSFFWFNQPSFHCKIPRLARWRLTG